MILSLATAVSMSGGGGVGGGGVNSSSLDPFDSSTWGFSEDSNSTSFSNTTNSTSSSTSSSSSSSPDPSLLVLRTLIPDDLLLLGPMASASASASEIPPSSSSSSTPPPPPALLLREVSPWDVALCVTGTLISCENALVLAVLFYTPTLRAPTFILIGSLATADLLAGLGLILHFVCSYLVVVDTSSSSSSPSGGELLTLLLPAGLLIAAFSASVLNVLAITVDRYLSLYNALTYHTERTLTLTYGMALLAWVAGAALGLLPPLGWNCLGGGDGGQGGGVACSACRPVTRGNAAALGAGFLLVFALMTQLYLQICRVALRHAQQIAVQHQFLAMSTTKGVSTLSAILCAFGACWLPFAVFAMVADASYPPAYAYAAALPAACGSALNPLIYAFRNPDIQKSLWVACCGCVPANLSLRPRTSSDV